MMTIYAAENRLEYVLQFFEERQLQSSKRYKKTNDRLDNIIAKCADIITYACAERGIAVEDVFHIERKTTDDIEPSNAVSREEVDRISDTLVNLQRLLSNICNTSTIQSQSSLTDNSPEVDTHEVEGNVYNDPKTSEIPPKTPNASHNASRLNKKQAMKLYSDAIDNAVNNTTTDSHHGRCLRYIQSWFHTRFNPSISGKCNFNIQNIPIWIQNITIVYGHCVQYERETGDPILLKKFKKDFNSWIEDIKNPESDNRYPIPAFVNTKQIQEHIDEISNYVGAILWDKMLDAGLNAVATYSGLPLTPISSENYILQRFKDILELKPYLYLKTNYLSVVQDSKETN